MPSRLLAAFSLRRNLRYLFVPAAGHLRPLDGIRALSILWVVIFHAGWYIGLNLPLPQYAELLGANWMLPVWAGHFGVDVFFVLSGFLIAGMLVDEREKTGQVHFGLFYARRLMRLWPALLVAVALDIALLHDALDMAWEHLLYVSNLVPILGGTMGWTWSLATEEQFYLVCPWLLFAIARFGTRGRVTALALLSLGLTAIAAWVVFSGGFRAIDTEIVVNRTFLVWAYAFDHLYDKPWMRAGPLVMGVTAAIVYRSPRAMRFFTEQRALASVAFVVAIAAAIPCMHWPLFVGAPRPVEVAFMAAYRPIFGACVAYVLLLSLSEHPIGKALAKVLSSRVLYPFGQLAYSAYLLNPIATEVVDALLAPLVWKKGYPGFALYLPFDVLGTFAAATLVYLFVERPFMALRPPPARA